MIASIHALTASVLLWSFPSFHSQIFPCRSIEAGVWRGTVFETSRLIVLPPHSGGVLHLFTRLFLLSIATEAPSWYHCAKTSGIRRISRCVRLGQAHPKPSISTKLNHYRFFPSHWSPIGLVPPHVLQSSTIAAAGIRFLLHSARVGEVERRSHSSSRVAEPYRQALHHRQFALEAAPA